MIMAALLDNELEFFIEDAIRKRVSDLHFDIHHDNMLSITYRRHKRHIATFPSLNASMYETLKYISGFDMAHSKIPQSGRFSHVFGNQEYYFRFAAIETPARRYGVLRILNITLIDGLEACIHHKQKSLLIHRMMKERNGLILFCGQTGSGKSTTMFQALKSQKHRKIFSLENPIEQLYDEYIQIEFDERHMLTLENGITQLLRHDPDIVIIGEIRTRHELQQCVRAALSGHLVVSTLHSGSAAQVVHRLLDLEISVYDLYHVLKGIIFQDLKLNRSEEVRVSVEIMDQACIQKTLDEAASQRISR